MYYTYIIILCPGVIWWNGWMWQLRGQFIGNILKQYWEWNEIILYVAVHYRVVSLWLCWNHWATKRKVVLSSVLKHEEKKQQTAITFMHTVFTLIIKKKFLQLHGNLCILLFHVKLHVMSNNMLWVWFYTRGLLCFACMSVTLHFLPRQSFGARDE